ncbi:hypothetical protein [Haloparvum sp. PAK95]|uniref:hypothetical protein n=1 Tax=Haloparvum sp. PAK95 TaxID=3418962 RepID=UPI003D2EA927
MRASFIVAVLLVGLAVAGGTAAGQPGTPLEGDGATFAAVDEGNNSIVSNESAGFGSSVSSFLQSTAAETNTAVDQGIWEANVEGNATAEEAQDRAARLGERVAELRAQRARLAELRRNGSISLPTYVARDARLRAELRSLGAAANQTGQVAPNATGAQQSLASVEQAAEAASGPPDEVANRTGAPSDVPGAGNGNGSAPGQPPANASNGGGPPSDVGDDPANEAGNHSDGAGNGADGAGNGADGAGNGADGAGNGTDEAGNGAGNGNDDAGNGANGTEAAGNGGADDSSDTSSNSASSSGTGSNSDSSSAGTTGDSSSGADGGPAGSAGSSDDGVDGSDDSGSKTPSDPPANPGPKSD